MQDRFECNQFIVAKIGDGDTITVI